MGQVVDGGEVLPEAPEDDIIYMDDVVVQSVPRRGASIHGWDITVTTHLVYVLLVLALSVVGFGTLLALAA